MLLKTGGLSFDTAADPCSHGEGNARFCALCVVGAVAIFWHAVFGIGGFMAGGHDPVLQREMFELVGLKQRIF